MDANYILHSRNVRHHLHASGFGSILGFVRGAGIQTRVTLANLAQAGNAKLHMVRGYCRVRYPDEADYRVAPLYTYLRYRGGPRNTSKRKVGGRGHRDRCSHVDNGRVAAEQSR